jgi:hypothetical protein
MGAGLSKAQFNGRVYRRLKSTQRQLVRAGVPTIYENYQLYPDLTGVEDTGKGFNIGYTRLNASNGETAGIPLILVTINGDREEYGWWNSKHGDFNKGIARIIELFAGKDPELQKEIQDEARAVQRFGTPE